MFKPHVLEMKEYAPPLEGRVPTEYLLLDFNERTIPVADEIKNAIIDFVKGDTLQMYPSYGDFTELLAGYAGVAHSQVMITNGSDQGIDIIIRSICGEHDEIIIPVPSFAMYRQCAHMENLTITEIPYLKGDGFPTEQILDSLNENVKLAIIPNPNNPTGTSVSVDDILLIAEKAPQTAIMVDECYFEYSKLTVKDHIDAYKNILITRTFSKTWGLPSVRLGYVLAAESNIRQLLKIRGPYDTNMIAVTAVRAALENPSYMQDYVGEVLLKTKPLVENYLSDKGIEFWPSSANFIFISPQNPETLLDKLQRNGILIRPVKNSRGLMGLRITLGTLRQAEKLIEVLEHIL